MAGVGREAEVLGAREACANGSAATNFVGRDEFEAVKAMAAAARDENEILKGRIAALEAKVAGPRPRRKTRSQAQGGAEALSEDENQEERDDGAPIEVLEQYFEARGWACERSGEGRSSLRRRAAGRNMSFAACGAPRTRCSSSSLFPTSRSRPKSAPRSMNRWD